MDKAHLDFETRSASPLPVVGHDNYSVHRSTDIMCVGLGWNDEPPVVMGVALKRPFLPGIAGHASQADWIRFLEHVQRGGIVVSHNAPFELAIWNNVGTRRYGWPILKPGQMDCTMARAYRMGLPGSLEGASAAAGLTIQKDMKGNRLMVKMSKPKTTTPCEYCDGGLFLGDFCPECDGCGELYTWHEEPEQIERLFGYCGTDVVVETELDRRLMRFTPEAKRLWNLDYQINRRGITVDVENARRASKVVELESDRLQGEMQKITNREVVTCNSNKALAVWIRDQGLPTKGVAKNDVALLLAREDIPQTVRTALEIRREAAKSSTAKLTKMLALAGVDARLRAMFQFHGANTGRWAARGVQLQNLPRPIIKQKAIDQIFEAFETMPVGEVIDYILMFHGSPMSILSQCLRGFLVAAPGFDLVAVDWNSIEARVAAWLAGEEPVLEVFRSHGKIYEVQAAKTYRIHYYEIHKDDPRRQVGKVQVLSLAYQGGVVALQKMCVSLDVKLEPMCDGLWALASRERKDRVLKRYAGERTKAINAMAKKPDDEPDIILRISKKEWIASELVKLSWREGNPRIVEYWKKIESAAISAVMNPGQIFFVDGDLPPIWYQVRGSFLLCTLPSGRKLCYPYPEVRETKTPWGDTTAQLTYKYEDQNRRWVRGPTYGGSLFENVVQAVSCDILADKMVAVDELEYPIVMHVHDEFVVEVPSDAPPETLKELEEIACVLPAWASGLPLAAEGWRGKRYRK